MHILIYAIVLILSVFPDNILAFKSLAKNTSKRMDQMQSKSKL